MPEAHDDAAAGFLNEAALCVHLDVSPRTVARWRQLGIGPDWVRVGGQIRYPPGDLALWVAKHRCAERQPAA
jgi:hypothetical protein